MAKKSFQLAHSTSRLVPHEQAKVAKATASSTEALTLETEVVASADAEFSDASTGSSSFTVAAPTIFAHQAHLFNAVGLDLNVGQVRERYTDNGVTVAVRGNGVQADHSDRDGKHDAGLESVHGTARNDAARETAGTGDNNQNTGVGDADPIPEEASFSSTLGGTSPPYTDMIDPSVNARAEALAAGQWYIVNTGDELDLNVVEVWRDYTGRGVTVAVYDEGVEANHPDLAQRYRADLQVPGNHAAPDSNLLPNGTTYVDPHGTAVAGIIASESNGRGTVGVAFGATLVGVDRDEATLNENAALMQEMDRYDVVNASWGNYEPFEEDTSGESWAAGLFDAVSNGRDGLGTIIVKSGGNARDVRWNTGGDIDHVHNDDGNTSLFQNSRLTLDVANVNQYGGVASSSTPGANLLVSAFGNFAQYGLDDAGRRALLDRDGIVTTDRVGTTGYASSASLGFNYTDAFGGTSAATPMVSGIVALMLEANPNLGWRDVQTILASTTRHTGTAIGGDNTPNDYLRYERYDWNYNHADTWNGGGMHFSNDYGFGLVDARAAVRLAENWTVQSTLANEVIASGMWFGPANITEAIPPEGPANEFRVRVGQNINIENVEIWLGVSHERMSDLVVEVRSPEGTWSTLLNRAGLNGDAIEQTVGWTLSSNAFRGEISEGEWVVRVRDWANDPANPERDNGTIANVSITAYGSADTITDNYIYTDEFAATAIAAIERGDFSRTNLADTDGGTDTFNAAATTSRAVIPLDGGIAAVGGYFVGLAPNAGIENAFGGDGNDLITGNAFNNELRGNRGGDRLEGGSGHDILLGGAGDDSLEGGIHRDALDGGSGFDWATYYSAPTGVTVSLADPAQNTGDAEGDSFTSIEGLYGSAYGDLLLGDAGANELRGGDGADRLGGGAGTDTLIGGIGDDVYLDFEAGDLIVENANEGTDSVYTRVSGYTLEANFENLRVINDANVGGTLVGYGNELGNAITAVDNVFTGSGTTVRFELYGRGGVDTLRGFDASSGDLLDGGSEDDRLFGLGGDDVLRGGLGADTLNGGNNSDRADYTMATAGVIADLISGGSGGEAQGDTYLNIEGINGSAFADRLFGSNNPDVLSGFGDADRIEGRRGNDTLTGGTGADTFAYASGWGRDTITDFAVGQDRLDMTGVSGLTAMSQLSIVDMMGGVRIAYGADTITLTGVTAAQFTAASFQFAAAPAGQTLNGTTGWGGTITGTSGVDTVSYAGANHAIFIDLVRDGGYAEALDGSARSARLVSIENVTGASNSLNYLHGSQGNNVLVGGSASDWLNGRGGSNTLDGRGGVDTADYYELGASVSIDLATGRATHGTGTDTLIGVEQFRGTYFADTFNGDGVDNYFLGMSGNDTIRGNGGADWLEGSDGADTIDGGPGTDRIVGGYGNDVLTGGAQADRFLFRDVEYGQDRITDFRFADGDRIDFSEHAVVNGLANFSIASSAAGAVVSYATTGGQSSIVLDGIAAAAITQDWFVF